MNDKNGSHHKHVHAYEQLLANIREFIHNSEDQIATRFHHALDHAKQTGTDLSEFTREELDLIGEYIKRDIHDAAHYLSDTGSELSDWLRFDTQLVEARLLEIMSLVVDNSRVELAELTEKARLESVWNSGETTGPGTLYCDQCDHCLRFTQTTVIPSCPKCNNEKFKRQPNNT